MDQFSPARLSESGISLPPSERFGSGTSGTRRVVATAPAPRSVFAPAEALHARRSEPPTISSTPRQWRSDGPLRRYSLAVSVTIATVAGGAGPLLASRSGNETAAASVAIGLCAFSLCLAVFAWASPHWHAEVRLDRFRRGLAAWFDLELKLLALDVRALPRAPKNLALYLASQWLLRTGLAGLIATTGLSLWQQALGLPIAAPLLGISLSSAALVAVSRLLGWALRLQPHCYEASPDALALAAREFPGLVDASRPLEIDTVFLQPTLLHHVVELLPSWRDRVHGAGADGNAAALQRHLWRGLPLAQIARRPMLGSAQPHGTAELLIDDAVLVAVQVGIDASRAHSLAERLRDQARQEGARPSVVVVVEARAEVLLQGDVADTLRSLHESLPVVIAWLR